jgi:hypothetical protein
MKSRGKRKTAKRGTSTSKALGAFAAEILAQADATVTIGQDVEIQVRVAALAAAQDLDALTGPKMPTVASVIRNAQVFHDWLMTGKAPAAAVLDLVEKDSAEVLASRGETVANIREQRMRPKGLRPLGRPSVACASAAENDGAPWYEGDSGDEDEE